MEHYEPIHYAVMGILVFAILCLAGQFFVEKDLPEHLREGYVAPPAEPELPTESDPTSSVVDLASVRKQAEDLSEVALSNVA